MPGAAILDDSLVDQLLGMVDDVRGSLNPAMGVRQFRVFVVRRQWTGGVRGPGGSSGVPVLTSEVELLPQPAFAEPNTQQALHYELPPAGRDEEGMASLSEVSLTYTEVDLTGGVIGPDEDFYYRVVDAHGQGIPARYYQPSGPPFADREKTIGWRVGLRRVLVEE